MSDKELQKDAPRLLVVDDDTVISEVLSQLAKSRGYTVHCVHDGNQILTAVAAFDPHVIFLDLVMPGLDGVEVIGILGDNKCAAKIVLMSGMDKRALTMVGNVVEEKQLELLGTIAKPPQVEDIDAILIPLREEIKAKTELKPESTRQEHYGLRLLQQPHHALVKKATGDLSWVSVRLGWQLDNGENMPMENALVENVRNNSAKGILNSLLRKSATMRSGFEESGQKFGICLTVPAPLVTDAEFPNFLAQAVTALSLNPAELLLEFDESDILDVRENKNDILSRLKIKGFGIAVIVKKKADELLASLNKLAIDELVIDMAYGLDRKEQLSDVETEYQYSSLASMSAKAGVSTSAKNVESKEQLEFATRCKFSRARGPWFQSNDDL